jgi:hypothetical protein
LRAGRSFNLIHFASSYKFDIFPLLSDSYHQMQFSRRVVRDVVVGGETLAVPVATAEDTLLKLVWYRSGGEVSERQWNDVRPESSPCRASGWIAHTSLSGRLI